MAAPRLERFPVQMTHNHHLVEVVHAGAAEGAVGDRETRWLDDVRFDTETGGKPQDSPGVLGDVGLEQRDPHDTLPLNRPHQFRARCPHPG